MNLKEKLNLFIENAPLSAPANPAIKGFVVEAEFVCSQCASRIMARGCWNFPAIALWNDDPHPVMTCLCCEAEK